MIISPIKFNIVNKINFGNNNQITAPAIKTQETDTFELRNTNNPNSKFNAFKKEIEQKYGNRPLNEILYKITSNESNILGEGGSKIVYGIPYVDKYVIGKIKNRTSTPQSPILESKNYLSKYNFGQPIADNGSDLIVMEKVEGESYSLPDFGIRYYQLVNGIAPITKEDAKSFLTQIKEVKNFPLSSFIDLAEQMIYLSENGYKADNINPNNILLDKKNRKFNMIDLFPDKLQEIIRSKMEGDLNSVQDMINITADAIMQTEYMKVLNDSELQELIEATTIIIIKCKAAGKITGLKQDDKNTIKAYEIADEIESTQRGNQKGLLERYLKFKDTYKGILATLK